MPFKPGQSSANPTGRPKASMANTIKRTYGKDGKSLLEMLDGLLKDPKTPPRERYAIVKELLDRGWGRTAPVNEAPDATNEPIFGLPSSPSLTPFVPQIEPSKR